MIEAEHSFNASGASGSDARQKSVSLMSPPARVGRDSAMDSVIMARREQQRHKRKVVQKSLCSSSMHSMSIDEPSLLMSNVPKKQQSILGREQLARDNQVLQSPPLGNGLDSIAEHRSAKSSNKKVL